MAVVLAGCSSPRTIAVELEDERQASVRIPNAEAPATIVVVCSPADYDASRATRRSAAT